jgi:SOS-response transcriptional repressor LexA
MSVNFIKENCDQWVAYAYAEWLQWVRTSIPEQYYLRESTRILVSRMRDAVANGLNNDAWNLLGQLKKLGNSIYDMRNDFTGKGFLYEQAEINLECAVVAYEMGDRHESNAVLDLTNGSFLHLSIHKAVACWISGCIHWQSQSHFDTALVNWEKSLQIVSELAKDTSGNEGRFSEGCAEIAKIMSDAIRRASIQGFPPPPPGMPGARPGTGTRPGPSAPLDPPPSPRPHSTGGSAGRTTARIRTYPVIGSIPAGSPIGIVDDTDEMMISDRFEINGHFYKAYNLKDGAFINLNQNQRYYLLKVSGESMNNALPVNIEDGDYVLMIKQDTAESGDIVAAEIDDKDRQAEATLKRYYRRDGRYILEPQSRNPDLRERLTFTTDFYIRGRAIAVFKRDD